MSGISIFDIIGPNMIGPSSSHTAGALRIALLASKLATDTITDVVFTLYGSFAKTYHGHGTDRALIAGILGFDTEDTRIKDSFRYAEEDGLTYRFVEDHQTLPLHPNTVDIAITTASGQITQVTGISVGGGRVNIKRINGVEMDFSGEYNTIIIKQLDTPGIVASITKCLSEYEINIAFMRLYREQKGHNAYTIIEADHPITMEVVEKIRQSKHIIDATLISI